MRTRQTQLIEHILTGNHISDINDIGLFTDLCEQLLVENSFCLNIFNEISDDENDARKIYESFNLKDISTKLIDDERRHTAYEAYINPVHLAIIHGKYLHAAIMLIKGASFSTQTKEARINQHIVCKTTTFIGVRTLHSYFNGSRQVIYWPSDDTIFHIAARECHEEKSNGFKLLIQLLYLLTNNAEEILDIKNNNNQTCFSITNGLFERCRCDSNVTNSVTVEARAESEKLKGLSHEVELDSKSHSNTDLKTENSNQQGKFTGIEINRLYHRDKVIQKIIDAIEVNSISDFIENLSIIKVSQVTLGDGEKNRILSALDSSDLTKCNPNILKSIRTIMFELMLRSKLLVHSQPTQTLHELLNQAINDPEKSYQLIPLLKYCNDDIKVPLLPTESHAMLALKYAGKGIRLQTLVQILKSLDSDFEQIRQIVNSSAINRRDISLLRGSILTHEIKESFLTPLLCKYHGEVNRVLITEDDQHPLALLFKELLWGSIESFPTSKISTIIIMAIRSNEYRLATQLLVFSLLTLIIPQATTNYDQCKLNFRQLMVSCNKALYRAEQNKQKEKSTSYSIDSLSSTLMGKNTKMISEIQQFKQCAVEAITSFRMNLPGHDQFDLIELRNQFDEMIIDNITEPTNPSFFNMYSIPERIDNYIRATFTALIEAINRMNINIDFSPDNLSLSFNGESMPFSFAYRNKMSVQPSA